MLFLTVWTMQILFLNSSSDEVYGELEYSVRNGCLSISFRECGISEMSRHPLYQSLYRMYKKAVDAGRFSIAASVLKRMAHHLKMSCDYTNEFRLLCLSFYYTLSGIDGEPYYDKQTVRLINWCYRKLDINEGTAVGLYRAITHDSAFLNNLLLFRMALKGSTKAIDLILNILHITSDNRSEECMTKKAKALAAIRKANALMYAYESAYLGTVLDYERQCMAEDAFYSIWDVIAEALKDLEEEE